MVGRVGARLARKRPVEAAAIDDGPEPVARMRAILMTSAVTGITYSGTIALNEKPISGFRAVACSIEKLKKICVVGVRTD